MAELGGNRGVPDRLQRNTVRHGRDKRPDANGNVDAKNYPSPSAGPLKGEDVEVEQADGDFGKGDGEPVAEQAEPPGLIGIVSLLSQSGTGWEREGDSIPPSWA